MIPTTMTRASAAERGLTIVELMVAMMVASILVVFLLGVKTQLAQAFRGQTVASDVGSSLRMAAGVMRRDLAHAGYLLPGGRVEVAPDVNVDRLLQGLSVRNNVDGTGNDELYILYANDGRLAFIDDFQNNVQIDIEDTSGWDEQQLVILGAPSAACLVMINDANDNFLNINPRESSRPFNDPGFANEPNPHCDNLQAALQDGEPTLIYSFTGRGYRIDPERPELGVLQMSRSAGLLGDDWIDVGVGFTNMQVAVRYYEEGHAVDLDGSGDPERNWFSGDNLENPPEDAKPIAISVSLEARSPGNVSGPPSAATPAFIDLDRPEHNPFGDWGQACPGAELDPCGIDLANTANAQRPARYRGDHIYRWTTITVTLRNMNKNDELVAAPGDNTDGDD